MALAVRGFNPIWFEVDLTAHPFDDTFYLFTLQNTIPYQPQTVWHDQNMNSPWTDPIQFLANGTLPIDIFFDPSLIYRLEFRQGPTQNDPLIYEVDNYQVNGSGGITPPSAISFNSENQITNPPVSYTHLDVYKRQMLDLVKKLPKNVKNWKVPTKKNTEKLIRIWNQKM